MKRKIAYLLLVIFFLAATLRFAGLARHDSYTDEAILAFRAIGLIDYDGSLVQTTPWQWLPAVPWWGHLSFHDHPVFFFLLQHASICLLGENLFAVRLPSVLAGIASVALLFFIGKKLFDERTGLIAASLLAVSSYHLWVSRLGIQDGAVIALMLLALWLAMKAKDDARYWVAVGATIGLGIITKYTIAIVIPMIALSCIISHLSPLKNRYFWYGVGVMMLISLPSWLYNMMLYRQFGHFDFQISGFLGQDVAQWQYRMGRAQVGGLGDRFRNFFLALYYANSIWFNIAAAISCIFVSYISIKKKNPQTIFLFGATLFMYLWFFIIGSTYRFVVMIIPFLILGISYFFSRSTRRISYAVLPAFLLAELLFSVNTFFLHPSIGRQTIAYAKISEETQNYGFNELDAHINHFLAGRVSALFGQPAYQFLTDLQTKNIATLKAKGARPYPVLIIYDHDINFVANLWLFQRHLIYRGWPILPDDEFLNITGDKREALYREQGIEEFVYIAAIREEVRRDAHERVGKREILVPYLEKKGIQPEIIRDALGVPAFAVYRFSD